MIKGRYYDLNPPAIAGGRKFTRARCTMRMPKDPTKHVMKGKPMGEEGERLFILRCAVGGKTIATLSENQEE